MTPNIQEEMVIEEPDPIEKLVAPQAAPGWKHQIVPGMIIAFAYIHFAAIYGVISIFSAKWETLVFMYAYLVFGVMGLTAGVHRLWSHKSYKAKTPLQIILMLCHSSIMQFSVIWWAQIHRQHHKYSDTDGDPMNATRGIFYSHIGWLLVKGHPDYVKRRKYVDVTDVRSNPVLLLQKKYLVYFNAVMALLIPTLIPLLWGESFVVTWYLNMLRLALSYNITFTINSIAHSWGNRPYDKTIKSTQNRFLFFTAFGDGFHNYHHAFPWDYSSGEWGRKLDFTTYVIDAFAKIGWAYDRKSVTKEMMTSRALRTGDGSKFIDE